MYVGFCVLVGAEFEANAGWIGIWDGLTCVLLCACALPCLCGTNGFSFINIRALWMCVCVAVLDLLLELVCALLVVGNCFIIHLMGRCVFVLSKQDVVVSNGRG